MLSVLFVSATRDPVHNMAIVNTLIVGLCVLATTRDYRFESLRHLIRLPRSMAF